MSYKKSALIVIVCVLTTCAVVQGEYAGSVFAIASHGNSRTKAYKITGDHIDYQATIKETEGFGIGACGLCVWASKELMFTTYESSSVIAWASTKTLGRDQDEDEFNTGIVCQTGLAGIVVDEYQSVMYVITRTGGKLYTYTYDEDENTLILVHPNDPENPGQDYRQLEGLGSGAAYGLVMDDQAGLLYVANGTSNIFCYSTVSWELEDTIDMGRGAAGIGLDTAAGYLYAGYFDGQQGFHHYLIRRDLNGDPEDPETLIEKDLDAVIIDISADPDTGFIYTTTSRSVGGSAGTVEVYDPTNWVSTDPDSLVLLDTEYDEDFEEQRPAGIAIGPLHKPSDMFISKVDDIGDEECVEPNDLITYTICYCQGDEDEYNVVVTDYLPWGVEFSGADPSANGYYTPRPAHTYTWEIGFVSGDDPPDPNYPYQCLELTVRASEWADPLGELVNIVEIESDDSYNKVEERTPVCCWASGVIYVDAHATGAKTGVDWENAYTNLQSALARAGECGTEIWVAWGVYSPGNDSTDSFEIHDSVEVYGGFKGVETSRQQRDFTRYATILTGKQINDRVVTMGDETVLDGFVIEKGKQRGIYGDDSNFTVRNCSITSTSEHGIYCEYGDVTVSWCVIRENGYDGIRHRYGAFALRVENCRVYKNGRNGIHCYNSRPTIINSMIYENGSDGDDYYGIDLYQPSAIPDIRNNTIVHNENEGIKFIGSNAPDIDNCIIWHNNHDGDFVQMDNCWAEYSCITNPGDPNGLDPGASTPDQYSHNITCDPNFSYDDPNYGYYHLDPASHCVDAGNDSVVDPNSPGEYDIDGDDRIVGDHVDMGADEVACDDVSNPLDWTADGIVNLHDFYFISAAWFTEDPCAPWQPTDPNLIDNWDSRCDLDGDYIVDIADLALFCDEWLWQACWRNSDIWMMGMDGGMAAAPTTEQTILETKPPRVITIWEEIKMVEESIDWLEKVWLEDENLRKEVSEEEWKEFIDGLYDWLEQAYEQLKE